jgi:hypothetical protein
LFFLRMYWDRYPARRNQLRKLLNGGRLRLTSSGVTTADTLLPSTEAILRDWLIGQEWLRENGIEQEPRLAYFGDLNPLPVVSGAVQFAMPGTVATLRALT